MKTLSNYHYPGNVRELKSAIEYAILNSNNQIINKEDLPPEIHYPEMSFISTLSNKKTHKSTREKILEHRKEEIEQALIEANGNRSKAAIKLGIARSTLYKKIEEFHIDV
jgi:transcriptional regulator with PAS, ATPase and Fis domain